MLTTSLFFCHNIAQTEQKETHVLDQLYARLQDEGVKIANYPGSPAEKGFQAFLQQQLSRCQWFLLFQTPAIVSLPAVRQAVNTALELVEQHRMVGVVRVIVTPSEPQDVPLEWSNLPTYDATYDVERAAEKLLLHLASNEGKGEAALFAPPPLAPATVPFSTRAGSFSSPTAPPTAFHPGNTSSMSMDYDRPPVSSSRMAKLGHALRNGYQDLLYERKRLLVLLSSLLLLTLLGSGLGLYFTRPAPAGQTTPKPVVQIPIYGQVSFVSTDMAIVQATTHTMDAVDVNLYHLQQLANGASYYAWLLPDVSSESGSTILVSQFTPQNGAAHLRYQSPNEQNLLTTESRFLITEESTSPVPEAPTADQSKWRYQGAFPQAPNPTDASHFSALDHVRHLLVKGPLSMMDMHTSKLSGGLAVWFVQNVSLLFTLASEARGSTNTPNPTQIDANCIQILDLLDGKASINQDVPANTPWLIGSSIANKPILTMDPNAMVPGYIRDIESHLLGFTVSPGVLRSQQTLAGKVDAELSNTQQMLRQVHDIAKQLVAMTPQQLLAPSIISQLDLLANASMNAYDGQLDDITGSRQGGVISIFDHLQQLAQFPMYHYSSQG